MVITIIVIEEILMANGLTVLMMCYLLSCRRKNRESLHTEDKVYDGIAKVNILGAVAETISFLVDGKSFIGCRQLNYISVFYWYGQYGAALVLICESSYLSEF